MTISCNLSLKNTQQMVKNVTLGENMTSGEYFTTFHFLNFFNPVRLEALENSTKIATISRILSDKYKIFLKPSAPVLSAAAAIM